jgi:hypothetical protein
MINDKFCIKTSNKITHNKTSPKITNSNEPKITFSKKELKEEKWKVIPNYSKYVASTLGRIKNNYSTQILKQHLDKSGYCRITLTDDTNKSQASGVHRLIAITWIANPDNKLTVNHINKIRYDNRMTNLEWSTHSEQNSSKKKDCAKTTRSNKGIWKCDKDTGEQITYYRTVREAAADINTINHSNISLAARTNANSMYGFKWKYDDSKIVDIEKKTNFLENEEWKLVEDTYYISNKGRIVSKNKLLTPYITNGYYQVMINSKTYSIHRLVAQNFIENPNNYNIVNHKNGNKLDNDTQNLEWCSRSFNAVHAVNNGYNTQIKKVIQYDKDNNILGVYTNSVDAGKKLNLNPDTVRKCCKGMSIMHNKNDNRLYFKFQSENDDIKNKKIDINTVPVKKNQPIPYVKINEIKKINVYNRENKLLGTYNTRKEVLDAYDKVSEVTILNHCSGKTKNPLSEYIFKYA